jgi:CubicO group peptidase (beta-lactamase class C family)
VTLRDLLCHRTGIRNNAAPFRGHLTRAQVVGLFQYLEPLYPFRTKCEYSNIGYALAGEIAASVAETSWEEIVTRRTLQPLEMTRTTADFGLSSIQPETRP